MQVALHIESDQTVTAVDRVVNYIEAGIQRARYAPGQRLLEPELMRDLAVSRGPVREAFRRLTERGLLQWERYRGVSVIRMTRQQVLDLTEIRSVLEGYAAFKAALNIDKQGRAHLKELERIGARSVHSSDAYDDYNVRFHALVQSLSGNVEFPNFIELTKFSIFRIQFNTVIITPKHMPRSKDDHAKIVAAIIDGDAKRAEAAMREHVRNTTNAILEAPAYYFAT